MGMLMTRDADMSLFNAPQDAVQAALLRGNGGRRRRALT